MMRYRVVFRREAIRHLEYLQDYIVEAGSPTNASAFVDAIISFCESLAHFPYRGISRDDIRQGLRTIGYRKRVIVSFTILDDVVAILGVFYGGRDHETVLLDIGDNVD